MRDFIAKHVANLPKSGIRAFFDIVAQRKDIVSLGVGEPDFDTPWHISRAAVTCLENGGTHYTSNLGTVELTEYKLTQIWKKTISALPKGSASGNWSGCGWTGQPLIVKWPAETRRIMNLYDWAKEKDNLVEVIYPTEDGNIYFLDLETGQQTRDTIVMRVPFKGTGSVDPRGWPLLYCGSGDQYENDDQKSRAYIISLINGRVLYEFGKQGTDSFARRKWYAYDSAPPIDAETDTLIYPGENGIVYTMKLNTVFDPTLGSISVNPSNVVKFRYDSNNSYEKIDIVDWKEDAALFISEALQPAKVVRVDTEISTTEDGSVERHAKVIVPDQQFSLAIGKSGQNVRLAARLTGFKIDIRKESDESDEAAKVLTDGFQVVDEEGGGEAGGEA